MGNSSYLRTELMAYSSCGAFGQVAVRDTRADKIADAARFDEGTFLVIGTIAVYEKYIRLYHVEQRCEVQLARSGPNVHLLHAT